MNLYFVRHGYAENAFPDEKRNLTQHGIEILQNSIDVWLRHISGIEYIITSPYTRAYQTAQIIADRFNVNNEVIIEKDLAPGSSLRQIEALIMGLDAENILIVGHMPDIAMIASDLLNSLTLNLVFQPSSIIGIETNSRLTSTSLKFFLPPVL